MGSNRPRSLLYVPAGNPRHLARLASVTADRVVLDLEDGVAPVAKARARDALRDVRGRGALDTIDWMLRVNAAPSDDFDLDCRLAAELRAPVVLLPKAESAASVRRLADATAAWSPDLGLIVETARGVTGLDALAAVDRVRWLIFGSADFRRSIGAPPSADRRFELAALSELLLQARTHGCVAVDSVYFRYRDEVGHRSHAEVGRALGFDGKSCIHPGQVATIHEVYASTPEELAWARGVRDAWGDQRGDTRGVVVINGEMIEALHLDLADKILERGPTTADGGTALGEPS